MGKVKRKDYVFLSKWDGEEMECACLFHKPKCKDNKGCEEIELSLLPYEDVVECMKARRYERRKGSLRQK
ncbi:hypothetical protein PMY38_11800 [Clostridium tertium]|uniref:hypothetical protein n=2 Tax=Clostridium tertium TaxID=1559 RepID=UPI0023305173|nr:hypothetical protein [Clostridium tertium]MBS6503490.1 hypothetical protein [Clostridium sp.]MDB1956880.1 hypothetical protein [Clostridium tertium]MDB1959284.1 hypothetical protein [Clostridium tertium]MDB1963187.1 hypothetical protein [Clostridium tertium]MDB1967865.1 hypothetical protein [Clostridium tertium]